MPAFLLLFAAALPVHPAAAAKHAPKPLPAAAKNSIAGVKIGMDKDDAHAILALQGTSTRKEEAQETDTLKEKGGDPDDALPEVWLLKKTAFERIAFAVDDDDKVLWVTGFARAGQGVPFAQIGILGRAAASGPTFAVWNVITPAGSYREIARGSGGKATIVSLLPLKSADPNGAFSPQIIPKTVVPKTLVPKTILPESAIGDHK